MVWLLILLVACALWYVLCYIPEDMNKQEVDTNDSRERQIAWRGHEAVRIVMERGLDIVK